MVFEGAGFFTETKLHPIKKPSSAKNHTFKTIAVQAKNQAVEKNTLFTAVSAVRCVTYRVVRCSFALCITCRVTRLPPFACYVVSNAIHTNSTAARFISSFTSM